MLAIYLGCLIFGGILLLFTFLTGGEADTDLGGHDFDVGGHDIDVHDGGGIEIEGDVGAHGEGIAAALQFLSFRNIVFFTAFFGLTGSLLTWFGISFPLTLAAAIFMGLGAAAMIHKAMNYLKRTQSGALRSIREVEGLRARVQIPVTKDQRGKISVNTTDQRLQFVAVVADEANAESFQSGATVTIVRIRNGIAEIAEEDFIRH